MIKCIATDMDGTLLNSSQQISRENKEAILKAQAQGIEVVVATGRSYQEATYILDEVGLKCPIIGVNGAEVRSKEGEILSTTTIEKHLGKQIASLLIEHDVYFEVYTNKGSFTIDREKAVSVLIDVFVSANPELNLQKVVDAAERRVREGRVSVIDSYNLLFDNEEYQIYKFLAFTFDPDRLEAAGKAVKELKGLAVSSSGHENLEITHQNAQKGIALEAFVKAQGIDIAETMAVGDNLNDESMLERAGRSVAMGNASFYIKSLCDVITERNDEHGVAKAILEVL
jgi:Cof subfamily protein (haloacid dehalogenase superfamily)